MCVTSLLCGPRADLWPFYGFLCKRFSLYIYGRFMGFYVNGFLSFTVTGFLSMRENRLHKNP